MRLDERTLGLALYILMANIGGFMRVEKALNHDYTDYYYNQDKYDLYYLAWGATWQQYGGANATND